MLLNPSTINQSLYHLAFGVSILYHCMALQYISVCHFLEIQLHLTTWQPSQGCPALGTSIVMPFFRIFSIHFFFAHHTFGISIAQLQLVIFSTRNRLYTILLLEPLLHSHSLDLPVHFQCLKCFFKLSCIWNVL